MRRLDVEREDEHAPANTACHIALASRPAIRRRALKSEDGAFEIEVPCDREGSLAPRLFGKGQTRIDGLDDKSEPRGRHLLRPVANAMSARGMSVRDIRGHFEEFYGLDPAGDLPHQCD
jgi:putative transposase